MRTIADRMKWVIGNWLPERKRFTTLEKLSGIPSGHWKNFWHGKQRAHEHMIQALARQWPEYALWLVTGVDDPEAGQTSPPESLPDYEQRTATGKFLARKVELDEIQNSTQTMAVLRDPNFSKQRSAEDETALLHSYADNLTGFVLHHSTKGRVLELNAKGQIPFDELVANDSELLRLQAIRKSENDS
ncbi:MAG: hypothetical protein A3J24_04935 [Deltaproteobacteria bacterium RIFCSPLOWO2_02_FULL_53_8]|nr:MAG: hypothetical protein A3J24_04935 [Deltaproteobacteria bacterium RIFCSPLOWO2_02_FULL_53_8]